MLLKVLPYGALWVVLGLVYTAVERGMLGNLEYYPSTGNPYGPWASLAATTVFGGIVGLVFGFIELRYMSRSFSGRGLAYKLLVKTLIYITMLFIVMMIIAGIANSIHVGVFPPDHRVWENVSAFVNNFAFYSVMTFLALGIGITIFYSEVSQSLGPGVLTNFFTGKYHAPIQENRIFMFLDMKSSTTIAEQLGHVTYFQMLKQYYSDLSSPIVDHGGLIYQYVGDEMVLTWEMGDARTNALCLECFFAMKTALQSNAAYYNQNFGLTPTFKAGIHCGSVTTGEIGVLKREIIFTGDVLNSAARIQGLCNSYDSDLLVSGHFLEATTLPPTLSISPKGVVELRGRGAAMEIFAVTKGL